MMNLSGDENVELKRVSLAYGVAPPMGADIPQGWRAAPCRGIAADSGVSRGNAAGKAP